MQVSHISRIDFSDFTTIFCHHKKMKIQAGRTLEVYNLPKELIEDENFINILRSQKKKDKTVIKIGQLILNHIFNPYEKDATITSTQNEDCEIRLSTKRLIIAVTEGELLITVDFKWKHSLLS